MADSAISAAAQAHYLPPDSDLSVQYLAKVFGEGWQHFLTGGTAMSDNSSGCSG